MGRKGPRAKTKTVLKSVSQGAKFGTMQNLKFQTLHNKNPPTIRDCCSKDDATDFIEKSIELVEALLS